MALPARYDMTCPQGTDWSRTLTVNDSGGSPLDLTSYTARMSVRKKVGGTEIISLTTVNGRITLGGAAGTIVLSITSADSANLAPAGYTPIGLEPSVSVAPAYVYDLEIVSPTAAVTRVCEGTFTVTPEVTR